MMPGVFFIVLLINYPKFNKKEEKALERIRELMYECGGEESPVKKLKCVCQLKFDPLANEFLTPQC
jgi:hypothetical protein